MAIDRSILELKNTLQLKHDLAPTQKGQLGFYAVFDKGY